MATILCYKTIEIADVKFVQRYCRNSSKTFLLMNIVDVQEVSEDKLEDSCHICEYKDDARGMMKTHNTSFHKCILCIVTICNICDYQKK